LVLVVLGGVIAIVASAYVLFYIIPVAKSFGLEYD